MSPDERMLYERLDRMVLEAPAEDLKKIQEADLLTQLDGLSFYEAYAGTNQMTGRGIRQTSSKKKRLP